VRLLPTSLMSFDDVIAVDKEARMRARETLEPAR